MRRRDPDAREDAAAALDDLVGQALADDLVVDDAGGGHEDRGRGPTAWGSCSASPAADSSSISRPLRRPRSASAASAGTSSGEAGHHDLPAALPRDARGGAVLLHLGATRGAEPGLGRSGLVVEAGVDDPGVVAALVGGDLLALEQHEVEAGAVAEQRPGGGQADDPAADHDDVDAAGGGAHSPETSPLAV